MSKPTKQKEKRVNVALSKTAHARLVTARRYDSASMPTLQTQVEHIINAYSERVLKKAGAVLPDVC